MSAFTQAGDPNKWIAPKWHPDFGNPNSELEKLRVAGVSILDRIPQARVELQCLEEGYMYLAVFQHGATIGEIQIVDSVKDQQYGVFLEVSANDDEAYFSNADSAVSHIVQSIS